MCNKKWLGKLLYLGVTNVSAQVISCVQLFVNPWSLPGSSAHGIFQARILEWVAIPSSRGSSDSGIELVSLASPALTGRFFTTSTTWEALREEKILCFHGLWSVLDLMACILNAFFSLPCDGKHHISHLCPMWVSISQLLQILRRGIISWLSVYSTSQIKALTQVLEKQRW